jgi:hypothetical protein
LENYLKDLPGLHLKDFFTKMKDVVDNSTENYQGKRYDFRAIKCIFADSPGRSINYPFATSLEQTLSVLRLEILNRRVL